MLKLIFDVDVLFAQDLKADFILVSDFCITLNKLVSKLIACIQYMMMSVTLKCILVALSKLSP